MKFSTIILLLFGISLQSFSQTKVESFEFFNNMKGFRIVVVDTAILHVGPSAGAANTDTLFLGEEINVLMPVPYFEQVIELEVPWLKITYFKKGFTKVSYILAHQVSLTKPIVVEGKNWLTVIRPNEILKEKLIHIFCVKEKKIENNSTVQIPNNFTVDSIQLSVAEKPCLRNSASMFNLLIISNKAEEGLYNKWVVECENSQISQLPFIHNYFNSKLNANIEEIIYFPNQNCFKISSKILTKKTKEKVTKYSWQDCNYINL